jgi:protein SCO1
MKTSPMLLFAALLAAPGYATAPGAKPACCATETPKCCATATTADKPAVCCTAPVTDRSVYQLDAPWTDDAGQPVHLASLRGRPVVLGMFFATCEYACPVLVNDLKRMLALMPAEKRAAVRPVLVTFDTVRDTPEALRAFRERMELGDEWVLLRGSDSAVRELAMVLGVKYKQDARGQFAHSNLLTILNPEGELVHQHAGLMGDVSEAANAVVRVSR